MESNLISLKEVLVDLISILSWCSKQRQMSSLVFSSLAQLHKPLRLCTSMDMKSAC
jgi:hypothetical protein